jgi:Zn ribbon nucleic-acid-binding protein
VVTVRQVPVGTLEANFLYSAHVLPFFACNLFLQLNMWSFDQISVSETHKCAYHHPFFVRGQKLACQHVSREIFKAQPLTKISKKETASENLVLAAALDARKPSISTEKAIGISDMMDDDCWTESESIRASTKSKTAALGMMSSESSSEGVSIPHYYDLQCNTNEVVGSRQISEGNPMRIEKHPNDVFHCAIPLNLPSIRHTTGASDASANILGHNYRSSYRHVNKQVLAEGDLVEFEGRPFYFVDMELDIIASIIL